MKWCGMNEYMCMCVCMYADIEKYEWIYNAYMYPYVRMFACTYVYVYL